jgi:hypothetical protein
MSENFEGMRGAGPAQRPVEMGVAVAIAVFALVVIAGSVQVGIGWGAEGPKAGFFPFYVGLVILGSSMINFGAVWSERRNDQLFAEWGQLGKVMSRGSGFMSPPCCSLPYSCDGSAVTAGAGSPRSRWACRS